MFDSDKKLSQIIENKDNKIEENKENTTQTKNCGTELSKDTTNKETNNTQKNEETENQINSPTELIGKKNALINRGSFQSNPNSFNLSISFNLSGYSNYDLLNKIISYFYNIYKYKDFFKKNNAMYDNGIIYENNFTMYYLFISNLNYFLDINLIIKNEVTFSIKAYLSQIYKNKFTDEIISNINNNFNNYLRYNSSNILDFYIHFIGLIMKVYYCPLNANLKKSFYYSNNNKTLYMVVNSFDINFCKYIINKYKITKKISFSLFNLKKYKNAHLLKLYKNPSSLNKNNKPNKKPTVIVYFNDEDCYKLFDEFYVKIEDEYYNDNEFYKDYENLIH